MNQRSFKRGMEPPELKRDWTREIEHIGKAEGATIEEQLRNLFEKVLKLTLDEIDRQAAEEIIGRPINSWGVIEGASGQSFRITLECEPPTIDPNLN